MIKPITRTIYTMLVMMLCVGTSAQETTDNNNGAPNKAVTSISMLRNCDGASNLVADYDMDCNAVLIWDAPANEGKPVVYNNGPMVTHPGEGPDGADRSFLHPEELTLGMNYCHSTQCYITDDFTLDDRTFITEMEFYGIQANAATNNIFTAIYVEIYDGPPHDGGTKIFGDMTTNRFISSEFSGIYRTASDLSMEIPIMNIIADMSVELEAGTYWVLAAPEGDPSLGISYGNPCSSPEGIFEGNAMLYNPELGGWGPFNDAFGTKIQYALPFIIYGKEEAPLYNVYRDEVKIAGPIEETVYVDTGFDTSVAHEWAVAVVCENGEDSEWERKTLAACCTSPTNVNAAIDTETCKVTLTWEGEGTFKITKNGAVVKEDATTPYSETIEQGIEIEFCVIGVCSDGDLAPECAAKVQCPSSVGNLGESVNIYPNPATSVITIEGKEIAKVEVYNIVGQMVEMILGETSTVDVSAYNNGIYLFRIYDANDNVVTKRMIIRK